jgi:SAM-dependent methyltransferase
MPEAEGTTDDERMGSLSLAGLTWNAPLSGDHADRLLDRLDIGPSTDLLDLGCGAGELLLRALVRAFRARGVGVDQDESQLRRGRNAAAARALADRVTFERNDATETERSAERVLCVGAAHIWGGTTGALTRLSRHVAPGGRLLFGDGFWSATPSPDALSIFGELSGSLADLVDSATGAGWRPLHVDTADLAEWDDFESTYLRGLETFALAHPDDPLASRARAHAEERRSTYLRVYRGVLGFAYLVLARE